MRGLCWVLGQFRLEAKEADCLLYFSSAAGLREFLSLLENTDGAGTHGPCPIHSQLHAWHELRVTASQDSLSLNQKIRSVNLFGVSLGLWEV